MSHGLAIFVATALVACNGEGATETADVNLLETAQTRAVSIDDPIEPIPLRVEVDARKRALGERLFRDPILSPDGAVACTTCHDLANGGDDGRTKSDIVGRTPALVNTPSIFNAAFNFRLHWGGGYDELAAQLKVPIESPRVMATSFDEVLSRLRTRPDYRDAFAGIYPEGITQRSFTDAIVEFERSLVTPNAAFDRWLRGEADALTEREKEGYSIFKSHGCISCHQGVNVGGNMFQKLGVMREFFEERGTVTEADLGRYNVTKRDEDRHVFRVPSLRNVAVTGPYFHDGSAETLEEAVQIMSVYQLGRPLDDDQVDAIVAFLRTLTGRYEGGTRP